ncbi:DUF47 domain-containing protein [Chitinivibrio alkaliphilus]|uniref:Putative phosphate transport system regulatory protein PhoU n=1 Tax=Chitinivibrio alkaliphilus ACht1 TaxID=1313304 RepID=U7DBH3_9BACT|nr:DUF47 family protein [Chitinivibrio alkaliphilus]ERP31775.1 putative phosphate transport system regulatory protein PhoU [Chitinivibrio alkaliphilus ACht1]
MFGKKHRSFLTTMTEFVETCQQSHSAFLTAMHEFISAGKTSTFHYHTEELIRLERKADAFVSAIKDTLYKGFLLPDAREDITLLVETFDNTIDIAEDTLRYIISRNLSPLPFLHDTITVLLKAETACFEETCSAFLDIFGKNNSDKLKRKIENIGAIETQCDSSEFTIISHIYEDPNKVPLRFESACLIEKISTIADACEDTAEVLNIMNIKRVL